MSTTDRNLHTACGFNDERSFRYQPTSGIPGRGGSGARVDDRGVMDLSTHGDTEAVPYSIKDFDLWPEIDDDPHNYASFGESAA